MCGHWTTGVVIELTKKKKLVHKNIYIYFFPSLRAGGILQILQSDWFRERAVFYDLAATGLCVVCEWAKTVIFKPYFS